MLLEDKASVEAVLDERDPSRLRIDVRVHPAGGGSFSSEASEIQRLIRDGFRDALREAQLDRLMLATNPQPKRRGRFVGMFGSLLVFFACVGLGAFVTLVLTAYRPNPSDVARLEALQSPAATPGSQSSLMPGPSAPPQSPASESPSESEPSQSVAPAGSAEKEPGPGTFGLHQN
jgi:hypothetical protein